MDSYCRCDGYWDPVAQTIVRVDCSRCTLPGHVETEKEERGVVLDDMGAG